MSASKSGKIEEITRRLYISCEADAIVFGRLDRCTRIARWVERLPSGVTLRWLCGEHAKIRRAELEGEAS